MPVPDFSPGEVLTAAAMDSIGLWLVKTQTLNTGATTVDVTSCFTADYSNYRLVFDGLTTSSRVIVNIKGLVGSTPTSTGYYMSGFEVSLAGALTGRGQTNATSGETGVVGGTVPAGGYIDIYGPQKATRTSWVSHGIDVFTSGAPYRAGNGFQDSNTQFTGIQLFGGASNFTGGTIRVYGYRN
jgi:hypothetical protein